MLQISPSIPAIETASILQLDQVSRRFAPTAPPAVASVSLTMRQGDLLSLLGPSGCGKTTLLRLIAGFESPEGGSITIADQPVAGAGQWVPPEKRGVGMVFQDYALFPHLTISQNVAFGLSQKPSATVQQRIQEVLALVGLEGMEARYPHQLSGGQQQRVALARALAPHPFLVLLDEPLSNLDVQVRLRLRQELRDILKAAGTSAVFVTHDQEEALSIADQVAVMRQGHLEQIGTPEDLYRQPTSRFVAEFVTQANFLPARYTGPGWETELGVVPTAQMVAGNAGLDLARSTPQTPLDLMVRQEDLRLHPDADGPLVVRDRQFLGREYRYCVQTSSGLELVARTPCELRLPVGAAVQVTIAPGAMLRAFAPQSDASAKPD